MTGSRALPPGTHGVKYIVSNGCGAVKECDTSIVVWAKLPTPICINMATAVMKNGKVDLWAKHFDFKSVGYCGTKYLVFTFNNERPVQSKIKLQHYFKGNGINATKAEYDEGLAQIWIPEISIRQRPNMPNGEPDWRGPDTTLIGGQSGMAFGCKVGDGSSFPESNIKMTVWDDKWNSEFCAVKVSFVDNQNACTPPPPPAPKDSFVILAGSIYYPNGSMFPAVKVKLSASLPEFPIIESSDTVGGYVFEQLPTQKNYKITASYQSDFLDGVNNGDMMVLLKHVLDIEPITSKSKLIAADINGDGIVEVDDLRLLMQALMGAIDVSKMESYRFVDKKQFDMDSIWPINYHITHDSLMENVLDNDLVAIKIGDLEAVKEPEERQLVFRSASNLDLIVEDKYVKTGDVIDIPFILDQNLSFEGLQAAISLSNFDMLQVESNVFGIKSSDFTIQDDVLKLVLIDVVSSSASAGDQVIHLKLKARKDGKLSNLLQLAANIMDPIVFSGANMEERTLQLKFVNSSDKISSLMNAPNPWSDKTAIYFNAQREGNAQVSIFDLSGRTILERTISVSQGDNVLEISNDQMSNVQGLLIYKLAIGQDVKVGKMMKVE
ncbi:MAG TPA: T9SS type A sorting domain-containing protein, partial [Saprospiraceae bacterium]|nr:T9SS type A sorting domain-containing protein [Saprospiraceae bacterium]